MRATEGGRGVPSLMLVRAGISIAFYDVLIAVIGNQLAGCWLHVLSVCPPHFIHRRDFGSAPSPSPDVEREFADFCSDGVVGGGQEIKFGLFDTVCASSVIRRYIFLC